MSKSAAKTVNKNVNKDVDTIFYYNRKIETYKNRGFLGRGKSAKDYSKLREKVRKTYWK